jgi:hypothetical protein
LIQPCRPVIYQLLMRFVPYIKCLSKLSWLCFLGKFYICYISKVEKLQAESKNMVHLWIITIWKFTKFEHYKTKRNKPSYNTDSKKNS